MSAVPFRSPFPWLGNQQGESTRVSASRSQRAALKPKVRSTEGVQ